MKGKNTEWEKYIFKWLKRYWINELQFIDHTTFLQKKNPETNQYFIIINFCNLIFFFSVSFHCFCYMLHCYMLLQFFFVEKDWQKLLGTLFSNSATTLTVFFSCRWSFWILMNLLRKIYLALTKTSIAMPLCKSKRNFKKFECEVSCFDMSTRELSSSWATFLLIAFEW